jgi:hypothetical protein
VSTMRYQVIDRPVFAIIGWAMQGGDTHGRVRVLASRTLSAADLEVRRERYEDMWIGSEPARRYLTESASTVVTVEARDFIMIEAANWREIMEALYRRWSGAITG